MTTVIIGPKTRLGRALFARSAGDDVIAVARDARDAAELDEAGFPASVVVDVSVESLGERIAAGSGPVRLVIAALGPVHPDESEFADDLAAAQRDLALVDQILTAGRPVQVVLVSTVIALAPGKDRRYYGGWKCLLEATVEQRIRSVGSGAGLAVLYPGRLREGRAIKPWHRLHASYDRLAQRVLDPGLEPAARRKVGADSRIWLLVRSISFAVASLGS